MNLIIIGSFILTFMKIVKSNDASDEWESPINNFFAFPDVRDTVIKSEKMFHNVNTDTSEVDSNSNNLPDTINSDGQIEIVPVDNNEQKNIFRSREQHLSHSYLLRIVNIILHYTKLKSSEMNLWQDETTATVDMTFSEKTLKTLQRFSAGQSVPYDELDECFVSMFKINDRNKDEEATYSLAEYLWYLPLLIGIFVILGMTFYLIKTAGQSIPRLLFNISLLAFFLSFFSSVGISLWGQYEDISAKRIMEFSDTLNYRGQIPDECFPNKVALHKRVYNFVTGDNKCEKYWNSRKSILVELDFGKAFTGSFFNLIFQFLPQFGDSLGSFVKRFSDYFPFPFNWIMSLVIVCFFGNSFFQSLPSLLQTSFFSSHRQRQFDNTTQQGEAYQLPPTQPVNNWYIFGNNSPPNSSGLNTGLTQNTRHRIKMQQILKKQQAKKAIMLSNVLAQRKHPLSIK